MSDHFKSLNKAPQWHFLEGIWSFQVRPEPRRHRVFDHFRLDLKWPDTGVWVCVSPCRYTGDRDVRPRSAAKSIRFSTRGAHL